MNYIVGFVCFMASIGLIMGAYNIIISQTKDKNWLSAILSILGLVAGLIAACYLWAPITTLIVVGVTKTGNIHPLAPAIVISLLLGGGILVVKSYLYKGLAIAQLSLSDKIKTIINWVIFAIWIYATIDLIGIANNQGELWWITWHIVLFSCFAYSGYRLIDTWYPDKQKKWGLSATYVVNLVMTGILCMIFGHYITIELSGSLLFMGSFLCFNLLLFWLSYALGKPTKDIKCRPAYYLLAPWTLILTVIFGWLIILQGTHELTRPELQTARAVTKFRAEVENVERETLLYGFSATMTEAKTAANMGDLQALQAAVKKLEEFDQKQRKVERTQVCLPRAVEDSINGIKKLIIRPPCRDTGWRTVEVPTTPTVLTRIYDGEYLRYRYASSKWYVTHENGNRYAHSACTEGETKQFSFYDIPPEGGRISIHGTTSFRMEYRIISPDIINNIQD